MNYSANIFINLVPGYIAAMLIFVDAALVVGNPTCPVNCVCDSECTSCIAGYYGLHCSLVCPNTCHLKVCKMESGLCVACIKAYFLAEGVCKPCPKNCKECDSVYYCFICHIGYKGITCSEKCTDCLEGTDCEKDNGYCHQGCRNGLSGKNCDTACNRKCKTCDRYNKDRCHECAHNTFGTDCSKNCSASCLNGTCDSENGTCTNGCEAGYWGDGCNKSCSDLCTTCDRTNGSCITKKDNQESRNKYPDATWKIIAIAAVSVLLLILVIVSWRKCIKWRRRANWKQKKSDCDIKSWESIDTRVHCVDLWKYIQDKSDHLAEFSNQPFGLRPTVSEFRRQENFANSRFFGFCLCNKKRKNRLNLDDIDASYISTFLREREYIACADPRHTHMDISEFWRMVWQENCQVIVMLGEPQELHSSKRDICDYWPPKGLKWRREDTDVTCENEDKKDRYVQRQLTITKSQESRSVYHFQYKDWKKDLFPEDISSLKIFHDEVNKKRSETGPLIVHCSDGVGATGTYIALDLLSKQGKANGYVDINTCVTNLRMQRRQMVKNLDQYIFVHTALPHFLNLVPGIGGCQDEINHLTSSNGHENDILTTEL